MTSDDPQVIPYLLYEDAGAAMEWLVRCLGFRIRAKSTRSDGSVRHGELELDRGGVVMVGSPGPGFEGPAALGGATQLVRITVTNLEQHRATAIAAAAEPSPIEAGAPGWRAFSVSDPEGHQWYFTEAVSEEP